MRVDLNGDLGERDTRATDAALMDILTSANVACGFHAGSPTVMRATVAMARDHRVAIGAHPSFDDREGFGRRAITASALEVEALVGYQVGALAGVAAQEGARLSHVKPHGALYNLAARDRALADAIARAVRAIDSTLVLVGLSGSELVRAGQDAGLRTASEVFADRAYLGDGSLAPRDDPGAVMHDPADAAARAVAMVVDGTVIAVDGTRIAIDVETICVHGDTPGAVDIARAVRRALEHAGVTVASIGAV
jgi:UPF0271 protein